MTDLKKHIVTVLIALICMLPLVLGTRCYMCRDMVLKNGNRRMFSQRYKNLKSFGWVQPCRSDTFIAFPQVECMERSYITTSVCFPKRCAVKVTERYPILPQVLPSNTFFSSPFQEQNIKESSCQKDLCNGGYKNKHRDGLKCYHQCGRVSLYGLTKAELANYNLPVIPCDESTYNYCGNGMECGYIVGTANYTDIYLSRDIRVEGWYADCFYRDSDDISHVLNTVSVMMKDHPSLKINPNDLTKCDTELCNYIHND